MVSKLVTLLGGFLVSALTLASSGCGGKFYTCDKISYEQKCCIAKSQRDCIKETGLEKPLCLTLGVYKF